MLFWSSYLLMFYSKWALEESLVSVRFCVCLCSKISFLVPLGPGPTSPCSSYPLNIILPFRVPVFEASLKKIKPWQSAELLIYTYFPNNLYLVEEFIWSKHQNSPTKKIFPLPLVFFSITNSGWRKIVHGVSILHMRFNYLLNLFSLLSFDSLQVLRILMTCVVGYCSVIKVQKTMIQVLFFWGGSLKSWPSFNCNNTLKFEEEWTQTWRISWNL